MAKDKYYVVWDGVTPGIYNSWKECQLQIKGYGMAKYKSFNTLEDAEKAFHSSPFDYIGKNAKEIVQTNWSPEIILNSLSVDAACSGNPGLMEYQGVHVGTREQIFHFGPVKGTNNIGEFLALVHGLALLKKHNIDIPIYTDSNNAITWVKKKQCKTKLPRTEETEGLFLLIERAEKWLKENSYSTQIIKWNTKVWGEIPADFGRK